MEMNGIEGKALAIADFVGGFLEGMAVDNNLTELQSCFVNTAQTSELMYSEVETGIADIKHGGWDYDIQAALEFGLVALQIPQFLHGCPGVSPDIKALESWATIFTNPTELVSTVTKHYLLHKKAITDDIQATEADWKAHLFYKSGHDLADLLTLAVGPVPAPAPPAIMVNGIEGKVLAIADFVGGFLEGMAIDNNLTELQTCFVNSKTTAELMYSEVEMGITDIKLGGWDYDLQAALEFGLVALQIPHFLHGCPGVSPDIMALESWATIFTNPTELVSTVTKHYLLHKKTITADIQATEADWKAGSYYKSGQDLADLLTLAVGPVPAPALPAEAMNGIEGKVMAIGEFVGGFLHGMAVDNNLTELQACFANSVQTSELMYSEVEAGIADIKHGGWDYDTQAALEFGLVALQIPQLLHGCPGVSPDIKALESWAKIFTNPTELVSTVTKHYLLHKKAITADIDAAEADWKNHLYYKAGNDVADLLTLAVGPVVVPAPAMMMMPPVDPMVPDFTAGLIYGFTGHDHKAELEGCMTDLEPIATDAQNALSDLLSGNFIKSMTDIADIIWMLPDAVSSCGELSSLMVDINVMIGWAAQLEDPVKSMKIASKNWLFHGVAIKKDLAEEQAAWAAGDYYKAGEETAEVALGLLPLNSIDVSLILQ